MLPVQGMSSPHETTAPNHDSPGRMEIFKTSPADNGFAYRQIATAAIATDDAEANFVFIVLIVYTIFPHPATYPKG